MTTMPRPIYETKEDKDIDLAHLFDTAASSPRKKASWAGTRTASSRTPGVANS